MIHLQIIYVYDNAHLLVVKNGAVGSETGYIHYIQLFFLYLTTLVVLRFLLFLIFAILFNKAFSGGYLKAQSKV